MLHSFLLLLLPCVKLHIDHEISVRIVQRAQMNVTIAVAPPKEQYKKATTKSSRTTYSAMSVATATSLFEASHAGSEHAAAAAAADAAVVGGSPLTNVTCGIQ
jgi:hypothetical protein